jgi:hypothetical protein
MNASRSRLDGLFWAALAIVLVTMYGCGVVFWREVYSSTRSDGKARAGVEELCGLANCTTKVVVKHDRVYAQIDHRRGCNITFAEAVWVGPTIGVFVEDSTCPPTKVAYDTSVASTVPFARIEEALRADIAKTYGVSQAELQAAGGDVFRWAGDSARARSEFRARHPH